MQGLHQQEPAGQGTRNAGEEACRHLTGFHSHQCKTHDRRGRWATRPPPTAHRPPPTAHRLPPPPTAYRPPPTPPTAYRPPPTAHRLCNSYPHETRCCPFVPRLRRDSRGPELPVVQFGSVRVRHALGEDLRRTPGGAAGGARGAASRGPPERTPEQIEVYRQLIEGKPEKSPGRGLLTKGVFGIAAVSLLGWAWKSGTRQSDPRSLSDGPEEVRGPARTCARRASPGPRT